MSVFDWLFRLPKGSFLKLILVVYVVFVGAIITPKIVNSLTPQTTVKEVKL